LIVEGYLFLHSYDAEHAAKVFKLSTEVLQDKDNPYDSYAKALMAIGNNEEAIKNYKKSLAINPQNKNAERMIKRLDKKISE
jgi:tetratricopeptide (TPR) repeat protein